MITIPDKISLSEKKNGFFVGENYKLDEITLNGSVLEPLLAALDDIIDNKLPTEDEECDIKAAQKNYNSINSNLNKVDKFLDFIHKLTSSGHDIEMDTIPTMELLCNIQKAQKKMKFISDYLSILVQVNKDKGQPKIKSSISELITKINAA